MVRAIALLLLGACVSTAIAGPLSVTRQQQDQDAAVDELFDSVDGPGRKLNCHCQRPTYYGGYAPPGYGVAYPPPPPGDSRRRLLDLNGLAGVGSDMLPLASQLEAMRTRLLEDGFEGKAAAAATAAASSASVAGRTSRSSRFSSHKRSRSLLDIDAPRVASRHLLDHATPAYYPPYPPPYYGASSFGVQREEAVRRLLMTDGFDADTSSIDAAPRRALLATGPGCYGPGYYPGYSYPPPPPMLDEASLFEDVQPTARRSLAMTQRSAQRALLSSKTAAAVSVHKNGPAYPASWTATIMKRLTGQRRLSAHDLPTDTEVAPSCYGPYGPYYGSYPPPPKGMLSFEQLEAQMQE